MKLGSWDGLLDLGWKAVPRKTIPGRDTYGSCVCVAALSWCGVNKGRWSCCLRGLLVIAFVSMKYKYAISCSHGMPFFFPILIIISFRLSHSPVSSTSVSLTNSTLSHLNLFKMKFSVAAALFAAAAIAGPVEVRTGASICPTGLFSNAQCCAANVLGIVGLNCNARKLHTKLIQGGLLIECILIDFPQPAKRPVMASTLRTFAPRLATSPFVVLFPL